jgi:hypothetical protein
MGYDYRTKMKERELWASALRLEESQIAGKTAASGSLALL